MCSTCGGSSQLYEGNGHRMRGYPFAEQGVFVGICPKCDPEGAAKCAAPSQVPGSVLLIKALDAFHAKLKAEGKTECHDCLAIFPDTGALYCPDCLF